jgi:response regulator RpfG family c-di-GMP phosphodiesterase
MNILIIDDDGDDRTLFCETLNEVLPQANCIVCNSGEDGIRYLRKPSVVPNYIFLDIRMYGMDGKECLLKIKSMKEYSRVPLYMYTAVDEPSQETIYKKLGASGFINKTSSIQDLKNQLKALLH